MNWERSLREKRRAEARRAEYLEGLDERNKSKEQTTGETRQAFELLKEYQGKDRFMNDLKSQIGRGAGLWRPTPKQAEIVIRITNDSSREE